MIAPAAGRRAREHHWAVPRPVAATGLTRRWPGYGPGVYTGAASARGGLSLNVPDGELTRLAATRPGRTSTPEEKEKES